MDLKLIDNLKEIPFTPKKTLQAVGVTLEEFVSYVSKKVEEESMEMDFYRDKKLAYAHFEEEDTVYVYINDTSEEPPEPPKQDKAESSSTKKETPRVDKASVFSKTLMILLLLISSIAPSTVNAAGYFSGTMEEDSTVYVGLSQARFTTPTGTVTVPGFLNIVKSKEYTEKAFTLVDPNRTKNLPAVNLKSLPSGANSSFITAILAYREKFPLGEIASTTGINVTQRQLDEATQLAIWMYGSTLQVKYQIDPNSITDTAVRSLATEITSWATQQVNSIAQGIEMGNYIFPLYQPELDTKLSKINTTDTYVEYGPYTVSGQKDAKFAYGVLGGALLNSSKKQLSKVTANEQFYVRFPVAYTGEKAIRLKGVQMEYSLNFGAERVWLDKKPKDVEVQFSVGGTTGNNGLIQINIKDALTNKPVQGVGVEVSTTSPLSTVQSNDKGEAQYNAPVGTYKLRFITPEGYITPQDQQVQIKFAGDIKTLNIALEWSSSIVNFYTVDAQTLKPAGDSEAFIYTSDGKPVKRVAIVGGKVEGVVLPEGEYTLVQYKASGGFGINTGTQFTTVAGKVIDVTVPQDPDVKTTTINIENASAADTWVYTLSTESKVLFKLNSNNALTVPLPSGNYSILAQKSDGTATAGPQNFSTVLNGPTLINLTPEVGSETVSFNIVDTKKKQPIPNIVLGLFDEDHNLITYNTANGNGEVKFENVKKHSIYYINVLAAPQDVSGYFANGNRFLGSTREYTMELYSLAEIQEVTQVDTIYRVPNVTYLGASYTYPK